MSRVLSYQKWLQKAASFAVGLTIILAAAVFVPRPVDAGVTYRLPFSARLLTSDYDSVPDSSYQVKFSFYLQSSGGTAVWTETQTITIKRGILSTELGKITSLSTVDFNAATLYLGVTIGSDAEMTPRKQVLPTATSLNADKLQNLSPGTGANNLLQLDSSGNINIAGSITATSLTLQGEANGLTLQNVTSLPATGKAGQLVFNTSTGLVYVYKSGAWSVVGGNLQQVTDIGATTTATITVGGLTTTGTATAGTVSLSGVAAISSSGSNITINKSLIPTTSGINLGSATNTFSTGYFDNLSIGTSTINGTTSEAFTINTDQTANDTENAALRFYRGPTVNSYAGVQWDATNQRINIFSNEGSTTYATTRANILQLQATSNQIVVQAGGVTGTLSWTPATSNKTITLPDATTTVVGTDTTQTLTNKTLTSPTIQGTVGAGTGLTLPAFTASGNITGSGSLTLTPAAGGGVIINPTAGTSGSPTLLTVTGPAHTTLTASTEAIDVNLNLARTVQFATGALTTQRAAVVQAPTYGFAAASIITNAATLAISGAPVAGTNATITNPLALWVQGGVAAFAGNVGVGTTNPSATMHVVGQCVTADTKLRRKRRRKIRKPASTAGGSDGSAEWEEYWEEVAIIDIKVGDEILTLDEGSGQLVSSKVKALADMGVKTIYKLTTAAGKFIRTTGNHPYLARERQILTGRFEVDQSERIEDLSVDSYIAIAANNFSTAVVLDKKLKRQLLGGYNTNSSRKYFGPAIWARIIAYLIQHNSIHNSHIVLDLEYKGYEDVIRQILQTYSPDNNFVFESIGRNSPAHKAAYQANKKAAGAPVLNREAMDALHPVLNGISRPSSNRLILAYHRALDMSRAAWVKVANLRPGMEIAALDGQGAPVWDRIAKIEILPEEQVFDIEVDGTHNFVGNDIVAHNTYINSSATTGIALDVDANSLTTGSGIDISSTSTAGAGSGSSKSLNIARSGANANATHTAYGLYSNVINTGTTSTNIAGYLSASGATNNYGLIVENGNVGIGDTTPASLLTVGANDAFQIGSTGIVTAGTWNGTAVSSTYGGTGLNSSASTGIATVSAGTWSIASSLGATQGGTGQTTVTTGDLLYGSATNAWSKLAGVATGSVLISGGVGVAPSWSAVPTLTTSLTVPTIKTASGALALQPASGVVTLNVSGSQNYLRVYDSGGTKYTEVTHDGTNGSLTTSSGNLNISSATGGSDFLVGDVGSAVNLVFEESSTISGQGTNTITVGVSGDTWNLNTAATYNFGTLGTTTGNNIILSPSSNIQLTSGKTFGVQGGSNATIGRSGGTGTATINLNDANADYNISTLKTASGGVTITPAAGGGVIINPTAGTSGSPTLLTVTGPAHTTLAASTEAIDVNLNLARTVQFATGALTTQRAAVVQAPTYGFVGASTLTTAVTQDITAAPTAGTNATITNAIGLRVGGATSQVSAAGLIYNAIQVPAHTLTLTGTTQVTSTGPAGVSIGQLTVTDASAVTVDTASSLYIANAPVAAGSVTLTNPYSLWVDAGNVRFDGTVIAGAGEGGTPSNNTIRGANASGTNIAGPTLTIAAGLGTGTGNAGITVLQGAIAKQTSGATAHSLSTLLQIGNTQSAHPALNGAFLSQPALTWTDENTAGSGTAAALAVNALAQPTLAARNTLVTTTDAATAYIANAPTAGTNMTLTNAWALWVDAGLVRFDGAVVKTVQTLTVADSGGAGAATATLTPTSSYVEITCNDADGCDITMGETGIKQGQEVTIVNISANAANFADTAGVSELATAFAAGQYDAIEMIYISDRWIERGRSNN